MAASLDWDMGRESVSQSQSEDGVWIETITRDVIGFRFSAKA